MAQTILLTRPKQPSQIFVVLKIKEDWVFNLCFYGTKPWWPNSSSVSCMLPQNPFGFNGFICIVSGIHVSGFSQLFIPTFDIGISFSNLEVQVISTLDGLWAIVVGHFYGMILGTPWGCWLITFRNNFLVSFLSIL